MWFRQCNFGKTILANDCSQMGLLILGRGIFKKITEYLLINHFYYWDMFHEKKTCSKFSDQAIFRLHRVILKIAWVNNLKALKTQSAWHKATLLVHFGSGDCYAGRHISFHDYQSYQTLGYTDILIYVQKMNLLNCWEYFGSQFSKC